jgi:hypothetical protein
MEVKLWVNNEIQMSGRTGDKSQSQIGVTRQGRMVLLVNTRRLGQSTVFIEIEVR